MIDFVTLNFCKLASNITILLVAGMFTFVAAQVESFTDAQSESEV